MCFKTSYSIAVLKTFRVYLFLIRFKTLQRPVCPQSKFQNQSFHLLRRRPCRCRYFTIVFEIVSVAATVALSSSSCRLSPFHLSNFAVSRPCCLSNRVLKSDVIKMKFLKLWDLSRYSERTMSKRPTCQGFVWSFLSIPS